LTLAGELACVTGPMDVSFTLAPIQTRVHGLARVIDITIVTYEGVRTATHVPSEGIGWSVGIFRMNELMYSFTLIETTRIINVSSVI